MPEGPLDGGGQGEASDARLRSEEPWGGQGALGVFMTGLKLINRSNFFSPRFSFKNVFFFFLKFPFSPRFSKNG